MKLLFLIKKNNVYAKNENDRAVEIGWIHNVHIQSRKNPTNNNKQTHQNKPKQSEATRDKVK